MRKYIVTFLCAVALLTACGRIELYQNLSEEDANEILVLLSENGIKATKKRVVLQNEVSYSLEVSEADMAKSRSLLVRHHLPRRKELGLTGVYKEKGLIPTPDEQKARYLLALKGEIINSLEKLPQIVDADVILNVPAKNEFASAEEQKNLRPTASVIVRVRPDAHDVESITEAKLQQFVSNAIEGLNPRDVTVIISYLQTEERVAKLGDVKTLPMPGSSVLTPLPGLDQKKSAEIMGLKLDEESKTRVKVYILIFILFLIILSTALIVVIIQLSRLRRKLSFAEHRSGEGHSVDGRLIEGPGGANEENPPDEL